MISKKIGEQDAEFPILTILSKSTKALSTTELKDAFKKFSEPVGENLKELLNRDDTAIDQIIRNIVSHRNSSKNNMINRDLISYSKGMLSITEKGKQHLIELSKSLYEKSMK